MRLKYLLAASLLACTPVLSPAMAETSEATPAPATQHSVWTRLLGKYVSMSEDGVNRVDYAALKASEIDREALDAYIATFSDMDLSGTGPEEFAAWSNLYNALTVRYILGKYPLNSITDGYLFGGPWKKITVMAGGSEISLDGIEHDVLRKHFDDPRVHYAINCASYSCPNLPTTAWEAATLDADLEAAARQYINHPRGVTLTDKGLTVSSIYDWFEADFGGSKAAVLDHLQDYADPALAEEIRANPRIHAYEYDWSLNDTD